MQGSKPPHKRVEHIYVAEGGTLVDTVCQSLQLCQDRVQEILSIGSVWYAPAPPEPHPSSLPYIKPDVLACINMAREAAVASHGKRVREAINDHSIRSKGTCRCLWNHCCM